MTSEGRLLLDESFGAHVLESSTFSNDECDLSELCGEEKTRWVAEGVALSTNVDIAKRGRVLTLPSLSIVS